MFVIIGWVVVIGAVIGSFMGAGGHIAALLQPFELLCIGGASLGAFVVSNPIAVLKGVLKAAPTAFAGPAFNKQKYLQLIALLWELLQKARMQGMLAMEADIADPKESPIFNKYPTVLKDHHLLEFIVDYMRMMVEGNVEPSALEDLMNAELETHHAEMAAPATAMQTMADGLPAFGIVSAVMGVVHTMGSVGAPPAILGEMIAEALVGTFLGILLGYGFVGPLASVLGAKASQSAVPYECVKSVLLAYLNGAVPTVAIEFGRKVLYTSDRPSFAELEEAVRLAKEGPAEAPLADADVAGAEVADADVPAAAAA
jgi:chemotaxis protein MotA